MSVNTNTNAFTADLAVAAEVMAQYNVDTLAERLLVVKTIVEATDADVRDDLVFTYTAGYVRRGFRQMALRMERAGDQAKADVFWALRDDIDAYDDSMDNIVAEAV